MGTSLLKIDFQQAVEYLTAVSPDTHFLYFWTCNADKLRERRTSNSLILTLQQELLIPILNEHRNAYMAWHLTQKLSSPRYSDINYPHHPQYRDRIQYCQGCLRAWLRTELSPNDNFLPSLSKLVDEETAPYSEDQQS